MVSTARIGVKKSSFKMWPGLCVMFVTFLTAIGGQSRRHHLKQNAMLVQLLQIYCDHA